MSNTQQFVTKNISDLANATTPLSGTELFAIEQSGAAKKLTVDVLQALVESVDWSDISGKPTFATVATSGSYADLTNKPSLATVATSGSYTDLTNKPTLATVATSGSYNDLTNKPDIIRPAYSSFMDEITAVKTYPENNGRVTSVDKNHVTVTRTATGTTFALMSLIGSGTTYTTGTISEEKVQTLYNAGEYLPTNHFLYDTASYPRKWYFNVSMSRPAESGEGGSLYLIAYDTVNVSYQILASLSITSGFAHNEASTSTLVDFSSLTADEVIMVLYYRRSGTTTHRGVAMEWDWSLEAANDLTPSDVGLGNVDNVRQYSTSNPPPYPVTSVNGSTGAVTGLQTTSNLVTSVSSSSTNTQYPSAKLFYDTVGNIETLLASI